VKDKPKKGKCHFCEKVVDKDNWCFGCHVFVCDECDTNIDRGWGAHLPEDHQASDEIEE
jgi:hypothetical protein